MDISTHSVDMESVEEPETPKLESKTGKESLQQMIVKNLLTQSCVHHMIPEVEKLIVLDSNLTVVSAIEALCEQRVPHAIIWNSTTSALCGVLSKIQLVQILLESAAASSKSGESARKLLEARTLLDVTKAFPDVSNAKHLLPNSSLVDALVLLAAAPKDIPICVAEKPNNVLSILTQHRAVGFIFSKMGGDMKGGSSDFLSQSIQKLRIGTWGTDVATATYDTALLKVFQTLVTGKLPLVVVTDGKRTAVNALTHMDIQSVVTDSRYDDMSSMTVRDALNLQEHGCVVPTSSRADSLRTIVQRLVFTGSDCVLCVDSSRTLEGVVTVADILQLVCR